MAITETERVSVRQYLGFSGLNTHLDSKLEGAITSVQSEADGGSMPDDSSEVALRNMLTKLDSIETQIEALRGYMMVDKVEDVGRLDPPRGVLMLRSEGRRWVGKMTDLLGCKARRDVFSGIEL